MCHVPQKWPNKSCHKYPMTHLALPRMGHGRRAMKPLSMAQASAKAQHKAANVIRPHPSHRRATQPKLDTLLSAPSDAHVHLHMAKWLHNQPRVCSVSAYLPKKVTLPVCLHSTNAHHMRLAHDHRLSLAPHAHPAHPSLALQTCPSHSPCTQQCPDTPRRCQNILEDLGQGQKTQQRLRCVWKDQQDAGRCQCPCLDAAKNL